VNQFISGNTREGVYAVNTSYLIVNRATLIGVAGNGITPVGNGLEGIKLDSGTTHSFIYPGKVMYNGAAGIAVLGNDSVGNDLEPATISANAGLAIDLGNDGHTANGAHSPPGPNNWINYPVVTGTSSAGFSGSTCPNCMLVFYEALGNPISNSGGGSFLSSAYADGSGAFTFTFPPGVSAVSLQACDAIIYSCSEMSSSVTQTAPPGHRIFLPLVLR